MYDGISKFYDSFMVDTDYDGWLDFCKDKIGDSGIDVGCGSGEFTIRLANLNKKVLGIDPSPQMLAFAQEKAKKAGTNANFALMSAQDFTVAKKVDFITAICDVVNYLKNPEKFFSRAKNALKDNGVLIFDISTEYKLKNVLGSNTFSDETDSVIYLWNNNLSTNYVDMQLYFFEKGSDGRYTKYTETQRQYIHSIDKITDLLIKSGFTSVDVYSEKFSKKIKKDEMRVFFVAH